MEHNQTLLEVDFPTSNLISTGWMPKSFPYTCCHPRNGAPLIVRVFLPFMHSLHSRDISCLPASFIFLTFRHLPYPYRYSTCNILVQVLVLDMYAVPVGLPYKVYLYSGDLYKASTSTGRRSVQSFANDLAVRTGIRDFETTIYRYNVPLRVP